MDDLRCVLDTNVIVGAALLPGSTSRLAFDRAVERGTVLVSLQVIEELRDVLARKKFDRYISQDSRLRFLAALLKEAALVEPTISITHCRDPRDDKFLELALCGAAHVLITGDDDLIVLSPFRGVPIVTPREFLEMDL